MTWLRELWRSICKSPDRARYTLQRVPEMPIHPRERVLYAIGDGESWSVALLCSCGCGALIHLSLLTDDHPRWSLTVDKRGRPTHHPSIWRSRECRAHFILRAGHVYWCQR